MSRGYDQLAWVDYPETLTPISAANLNRMENGIANLYTDRNKLESNMAYVEDGDTSSRHYDIDAYLMHNGVFYKVTEEINIGDTLDYGLDGNIAHVDISSQFGSGGGGSTGCVELTQAQYDALSEEDKIADVLYLITDSPEIKYKKKTYAGASEAERSTYDNTKSGLAADNVQDALDELNSKKTAYPPITTRVVDLYYTGQYCAKACPSVSGYKAICVGGFRSIGDASVGNNIFDMYVDYEPQQLIVSFTRSFPSTAGVYVWIVYVVDKS